MVVWSSIFFSTFLPKSRYHRLLFTPCSRWYGDTPLLLAVWPPEPPPLKLWWIPAADDGFMYCWWWPEVVTFCCWAECYCCPATVPMWPLLISYYFWNWFRVIVYGPMRPAALAAGDWERLWLLKELEEVACGWN